MKLADEVLAGGSSREASEGVLAEEAALVANAKKIFLQAAGGAVQKYRDKLADEQELVGALANIVMEIYAMESSLLRAAKSGVSARRAKLPARCWTPRASSSPTPLRAVEHEARSALAAVHSGDMLTTQMAVLKRFTKRAPVDTIALRRRVAEAVQSGDRYPFEGR